MHAAIATACDLEAVDHDGKTPLDVAVEAGRALAVQLLLARGASASRGSLAVAVRGRHRAIVRALLDGGASIAADDELLDVAIATGDRAIASMIAQAARDETVFRILTNDETVVIDACEPLQISAAILAHHIELPYHESPVALPRESPLGLAVRLGRLPAVLQLLDAGADPEPASAIAARFGHAHVLHALASRGIAFVTTTLEASIRAFQPRVVTMFVMDRVADFKPALFDAIVVGDLGLIEIMLVRGADPNMVIDSPVDTPLKAAIGCGRLDAIELLLARGADPSLATTTVYGEVETPLDFAVGDNHHESIIVAIVEILIRAGADPSYFDGVDPTENTRPARIAALLRIGSNHHGRGEPR